MSVLFIALPLALLLGAAGVTACVYCIRDGQYDDLETPPMRILVDDQPRTPDAPQDETNPAPSPGTAVSQQEEAINDTAN